MVGWLQLRFIPGNGQSIYLLDPVQKDHNRWSPTNAGTKLGVPRLLAFLVNIWHTPAMMETFGELYISQINGKSGILSG